MQQQTNKTSKVNDLYTACSIIEGFDGEEHTQKEELEAWSFIAKNGAWKTLQGWYGRSLNNLVENGYITWDGKILI